MSTAAIDEVVYLDHNATTPVAPGVLEAMLPYLRTAYGNPSSDRPTGRAARRAVAQAREQVAALVGAAADEIVFTSGGTESNNLAIFGTAVTTPAARRRIVTSSVEHPATASPCGRLEANGWAVTRVPVTGAGLLDAPAATAALSGDVALCTMLLAQNETGALLARRARTSGTRRRRDRPHRCRPGGQQGPRLGRGPRGRPVLDRLQQVLCAEGRRGALRAPGHAAFARPRRRRPGVAASTGSACHAGEETPSATLLAMGVAPEVARSAVRLSLGRDTTGAEVPLAADRLVTAYHQAREEHPLPEPSKRE